LNLPPLQIKLLADFAKLPANLPMQLPPEVSLSLIRQRLAVPIGDLNAIPELVIDEDELDLVGLGMGASVLLAA
jgi:hypothetical protein